MLHFGILLFLKIREDIEITLRPSPCDGGPGGCLEQKLSGFFTNVISRKEQLLPISSVIHIAMVMATTSPQHVVFCRCGEKGNLKGPDGETRMEFSCQVRLSESASRAVIETFFEYASTLWF